MRYLTGKGFIGTKLIDRVKAVHIPHDQIQSTKLDHFTHFYFLSSYGNMASHTNEDAIFKANIEDLISVLKQAKNIKFKSFVFLSSSSVMLKTQTTYSRCKRAAEEILLAFMEKHDVPVCIIRPFSVTGVGEQKEHLIPTLLRAAKTGELVNLVPDAVHDFIDVDDVVNGIVSLSEHGARGIYQLGTSIKTRNDKVLEMVEEVTGKHLTVNYVYNMRPYDNQDWVSTNYKARGWGWSPRKTLIDSIREQYEKETYL